MCQHVTDVDRVSTVVYLGDHSIPIATDVENRELTDNVRAIECLPHLCEVLPSGASNGAPPARQRATGVCTVSSECVEPAASNHMHLCCPQYNADAMFAVCKPRVKAVCLNLAANDLRRPWRRPAHSPMFAARLQRGPHLTKNHGAMRDSDRSQNLCPKSVEKLYSSGLQGARQASLAKRLNRNGVRSTVVDRP